MSKIARHCDLWKHECITESLVVETGFPKPEAEISAEKICDINQKSNNRSALMIYIVPISTWPNEIAIGASFKQLCALEGVMAPPFAQVPE